MNPEGVNGQSKAVYDENYLKTGVKPKESRTAYRKFSALWDEAAKMVSEEADANNDGKIDVNDLPLLQKLVKNLQAGQQILIKNIQKFDFDAEKIRGGFEACEKALQKAITDITSGTYVSPKEEGEKIKQEREAKAKAEADAKAKAKAEASILEPTKTDSDNLPRTLSWDLPRQQAAMDAYNELQEPYGKTELRYKKMYKSPAYQISKLKSFVDTYNDVLDGTQKRYINQQIQRLEVKKKEQDEKELNEFTGNSTAKSGSNIYNRNGNGANIRSAIANARRTEDRKFLGAYGIDIDKFDK